MRARRRRVPTRRRDSLTSHRSKATVAAVASAALFAAMAMVARLLAPTIPGHQVALIRFAAGAGVVVLAWPLLRLELHPRRWGWLLLRGIFGGAAVLLYFQCIEKIGVGLATLLNYTAPVWSLLFAWVLLRERPHRHAGLALVLTLCGVALVTRAPARPFAGWIAVGVLSAVLSGMAITAIRATRRHDDGGSPAESSWTVFASFTLFGVLTTLPTVLPPVGRWVAPTAREWLLLAACSLLSVMAQLLMTASLGHLTAVGLGIIQQVTVVLTLAGGWLVFDEAVTRTGVMGSLLTVGGVIWSVVGGHSRRDAPGMLST